MRTRHAGPWQMPTNAKKLLVQHSPHKRMSKRSAGYLLAVRMNVRPHQYNSEHIFLWTTDSRQIVFACSSNSECCSPTRPHNAFRVRFRVHIQMWMQFKQTYRKHLIWNSGSRAVTVTCNVWSTICHEPNLVIRMANIKFFLIDNYR